VCARCDSSKNPGKFLDLVVLASGVVTVPPNTCETVAAKAKQFIARNAAGGCRRKAHDKGKVPQFDAGDKAP
jgi:hypothetical protein